MKVFPDRLAATLERSLSPVYLVAGPEALLVEESCDAIRRVSKAQGVVERIVLEADARFHWDRLSASTETGSLFATRRLVEVRLPSGKPGKDGGAAIRQWLDEPSDDVLLIKAQAWEIASEKSVWFQAVDGAGVFVPCWAVKPHQLPQWVAQRVQGRGLMIDGPSAEFLASRVEGNLLAAAQEIERLSLLYPAGHRITESELREGVADSARFDGFRLTELVLLGQTGAALRCIRGLMETETPMPMVVSALSRELQVLAAYQALRRSVAARDAFQSLRVWPSRQGPIEAAHRRLSSAHIARALAHLSELDRMSKSLRAHGFWVGLERLCVALSSDAPDQTQLADGMSHVA